MKIFEDEPPNVINEYSEFSQTLHNTGIPLLHFIPKTKKNHYFYKNGLSHIIPRLKVKVHSSPQACHELWDEFSPKNTIYDLWEYRYAFQKIYNFNLYFYTLYESDRPLAMMPLWYNSIKKVYEWFGGIWTEDNVFFVKQESFINLLLKVVPSPFNAVGLQLNPENIDTELKASISPDDPKNIKDIRGYNTTDDFLQTLTKKRRYNLRADHRRIVSMKPIINTHTSNKLFYMDNLINLNKERFSGVKKTRSLFNDSTDLLPLVYRNLLDDSNAGYTTKFIEVTINGRLAAIDLVMQYKNIYYQDIGGNNVEMFNGIGNFMVLYEFEDAIKNRCALVDCYRDDCGWKHRYFDQTPLYKIQSK